MVEETATVYVVEDDDELRLALATMIRSVGLQVREFSHPREFLANYDPQTPGCLVVDLRLPDMSGLELQRLAAGLGSLHPFLVISGQGEVSSAVAAMQQGALDYIEKPFSRQQLLDRVHQAIDQDRQRRKLVAQQQHVRWLIASLTTREREVLDQVVEGRLTKEIARQLGISPKTVEVHRANVVRKMGADNIAELIRIVMQLTPWSANGDQALSATWSGHGGLPSLSARGTVAEP
ncbi:MAG: response regulator transcription factor [Pirellulales bacterium]